MGLMLLNRQEYKQEQEYRCKIGVNWYCCNLPIFHGIVQINKSLIQYCKYLNYCPNLTIFKSCLLLLHISYFQMSCILSPFILFNSQDLSLQSIRNMDQQQVPTNTTIQVQQSTPQFSDDVKPNPNSNKTSTATITALVPQMGYKNEQLDIKSAKQQERPIVEVNETNDNINAVQNGEVNEEDNNNVREINYESIADRMLRQLEDEYWEVQKADIGYACHNSKNKQLANADVEMNGYEREDQSEQDIPEGYQNLDNDAQISDNSLNSQSSDLEKQEIRKLEIQEQSQKNNHKQEKEEESIEKMDKDHPNPQAPNQSSLLSACNNIELFQHESNHQSQPQLIEVGPTPDSVFAVPDSKQQWKIDCDKIKCLAQSLESELGIITPEWAKDPLQFEKRVRELFGSGSQKLKGAEQRK